MSDLKKLLARARQTLKAGSYAALVHGVASGSAPTPAPVEREPVTEEERRAVALRAHVLIDALNGYTGDDPEAAEAREELAKLIGWMEVSGELG